MSEVDETRYRDWWESIKSYPTPTPGDRITPTFFAMTFVKERKVESNFQSEVRGKTRTFLYATSNIA